MCRSQELRRREHRGNGKKSDRAMCACEVCEAVVALWVVKKALLEGSGKREKRDYITLCIEGGIERERERLRARLAWLRLVKKQLWLCLV